jgi:Phage portal protein, SPP1 Gp6-like.
MMQESLSLPKLKADEQATLNRLVKQLKDRTDRNKLRQQLYDNKHTARRIGDTIPGRYFNMGIVLGWTGKAVDALARRCTLDTFVWPEGDLNDLGARELWDENEFGSEINSAKVSSLIHGPAFLVNTVGVEDEPDSLIHVRDAVNATGEWNARRRRLDNLLSVTDRNDQGEITGLALYLDNLTIVATKDGKWTVEKQEHVYGVPAEPMVYKPRVGRPFGSSRITRPIMGLQAQAVQALIRLEGHMDVFSFPDFWLLGAKAEDVAGEDGANVAAMAAQLGRIRGIPDLPADDPNARDNNLDRAEIQQFPASVPTPNLAALNAFAKLFAREASLPDSAVAITDLSNPTSGESYDASQYELISESEGAVADWSPRVKRAFLRGLAIKNGESEIPDEWLSIEPRWRDPRYTSKASKADAGLKQIQAVPWLAESEVGLELLGLDEQQIRRALADKRRMGGSAALTAVADAVAQTQTQTDDAASVRAKADAMGVLIRAGVKPEDAAKAAGFDRLNFTGAVPVSLRLPQDDARKLEGGEDGTGDTDAPASS